jgi:hypothetical protein
MIGVSSQSPVNGRVVEMAESTSGSWEWRYCVMGIDSLRAE